MESEIGGFHTSWQVFPSQKVPLADISYMAPSKGIEWRLSTYASSFINLRTSFCLPFSSYLSFTSELQKPNGDSRRDSPLEDRLAPKSLALCLSRVFLSRPMVLGLLEYKSGGGQCSRALSAGKQRREDRQRFSSETIFFASSFSPVAT